MMLRKCQRHGVIEIFVGRDKDGLFLLGMGEKLFISRSRRKNLQCMNG